MNKFLNKTFSKKKSFIDILGKLITWKGVLKLLSGSKYNYL